MDSQQLYAGSLLCQFGIAKIVGRREEREIFRKGSGKPPVLFSQRRWRPVEDQVVVQEQIETMIRVIRGLRVILDNDIAALYQVETGQLVRAVQRNIARFPDDFAFRLSADEYAQELERQGRERRRGGRRNLPIAFTEHGVAMLSGVLRSERAVRVNVQIVRAFVRMRGLLTAQEGLSRRLDELEERYDSRFCVVFRAIRQLMTPAEPKRNPIGFRPPEDASL